MNDLMEAMNPGLKYYFIHYIYYQQLSDFQIFIQQQQSEIIFLAMRMKSRLNIADEEIITQGDESYYLYILLNGQVKVFLN